MANEFIGRGFRFPFQLDARGRLALSDGLERIEDSIWIILKTSLGERVMRPTFGVGLDDRVFDNNSPTARAQIAADIKDALAKWEPRIEIASVFVETLPPEKDGNAPTTGHENHVTIKIEYRLRTTNELFNATFPLNLTEGVT